MALWVPERKASPAPKKNIAAANTANEEPAKKSRKENMYDKKQIIRALFLPKWSAYSPVGTSSMYTVSSRMETRKPIAIRSSPLLKRNTRRKGSKNLRFLKNP